LQRQHESINSILANTNESSEKLRNQPAKNEVLLRRSQQIIRFNFSVGPRILEQRRG
jgi:hypothetical protein